MLQNFTPYRIAYKLAQDAKERDDTHVEKSDAAKAKQALSKARQSDAARNKALGVKALPGK